MYRWQFFGPDHAGSMLLLDKEVKNVITYRKRDHIAGIELRSVGIELRLLPFFKVA